MKRSSGQDFQEAPSPKRHKAPEELLDISSILKKKGDEKFYQERFLVWRNNNHPDDPIRLDDLRRRDPALLDSWRTFVRLENENRMERLLRRASGRQQERTPRSAIPTDDATGRAHTRESRREHQTQEPGEVPTYRCSADTQATGLDRSVEASSTFESFDLHERRSTQQSTGVVPEDQPTEVAECVRSVDNLWKWKDFHSAQIEVLQERCATLEDCCRKSETRCEQYEARCDEFETLFAKQSEMIDALSKDLSQSRDRLGQLQKNHDRRARQNDRLQDAVSEAGSILENLRRELHSRLHPLEEIKEQAFDVLRLLHAEKTNQSDELATLRGQMDTLQHQVEVLRQNH